MARYIGLWVCLIALVGLLSSCGESDTEKRLKQAVDEINKKEEPKDRSREVVKQKRLSELKKELSPKSPGAAIKGFFKCLKNFKHDRAYAYISMADQKNISRGAFQQKFGYEKKFGKGLNQCLAVEVKEIKNQGQTAKVSCEVTMPNLYAINKSADQILHDWNSNNDTGMATDELLKKLEKRVFDKEGKLLAEFVVTVPVQFDTRQEKGSWWIDFTTSWKNLDQAYFQAGSKAIE